MKSTVAEADYQRAMALSEIGLRPLAAHCELGLGKRRPVLNALDGAILIAVDSGFGEQVANHGQQEKRTIWLREIGGRTGILRLLLVPT